MQVIWKYPLELGSNVLSVPQPAKIVAVGLDGRRDMCAWIQHPEAGRKDSVALRVVGTGEGFDTGEYIGTIFALPFVWHVLVVEG